MCSKLKNVCQTCLFDLEYGLPVQVRDKYLQEHEKVTLPTSQVRRAPISWTARSPYTPAVGILRQLRKVPRAQTSGYA